MRIALVRQNYNPFGGAERFVERAIAALDREDLELTLLTRRWPRAMTPARTQILECNPFYLGRTWRDASFAHAVHKQLNGGHYALVQAHEKIAGCEVYRAGDGVHRVWLEQHGRACGAAQLFMRHLSLYHTYTLAAEKATLLHPNLRKVICISEMGKREIQNYFGLPDSQLEVIYNGIDLEKFSPQVKALRESTRAQWKIDFSAPVFLFVGSGFARKGLAQLIRTLPQQAYLLVVGKDKHTAKYIHLADKLDKQVVFAGPQQDVLPFYGAADAFVLPAIYEPFGNVILEALSCGLPTIVSNACGGAELIQAGSNGWICEAFDDETLHACLHAMLESIAVPSAHQAMCEQARYAALPLSSDAMANKMLALYHSLLS